MAPFNEASAPTFVISTRDAKSADGPRRIVQADAGTAALFVRVGDGPPTPLDGSVADRGEPARISHRAGSPPPTARPC